MFELYLRYCWRFLEGMMGESWCAYYSITADIEGRSGEYIVAAKRGFAVFSKVTRQLTYVKT
jgi:hypothetical protein